MAGDSIVQVVSRVTGRMRLWRATEALVRVGIWCAAPALVLVILDKFIHIPLPALLAPAAAFVLLGIIWSVKAAASVNRYEVAKQIDDELRLKDRLTSALYFERLNVTGGLVEAAIADARRTAEQARSSSVAAGGWDRYALIFAGLVVATAAVAAGPWTFTQFFSRASQGQDIASAKANEQGEQQVADATPLSQDDSFKKIERKTSMEGLQKAEAPQDQPRDPKTYDTQMDEETLKQIANIKAALDMKDLKGMEDAFKDDQKGPKSPQDQEDKPVKMAPFDKEMLDDIAAGQKRKMKEGEKGEDDALGVAVRQPATPGARQKGPRTKAGGQHGGGDVGESGDTRSSPKRVFIHGRDKFTVDSRKSKDVIQKTNLEKLVMNKVAMILSMDDVKMTGTAKDVSAQVSGASKKDPVVEESVPPGLRGYVQRYFNGIGKTGAAQ